MKFKIRTADRSGHVLDVCSDTRVYVTTSYMDMGMGMDMVATTAQCAASCTDAQHDR